MPHIKKLLNSSEGFEVSIENWQIPDSGVSLLFGESGSGKSTVVRTLVGLEMPTVSKKVICEWTLAGQSMNDLKPPERKLGIVFQTLDLFPHMTAEQNVRFFAEARKISEEQYQKDFKVLMQILKMQNFIHRRADLLSGGEKQRVALARTLIQRPQMLFLDEAFSALDQQNKNEARTLLKELVNEWKVPCLLISHDEKDLSEFKSQSFQITDGRLAM